MKRDNFGSLPNSSALSVLSHRKGYRKRLRPSTIFAIGSLFVTLSPSLRKCYRKRPRPSTVFAIGSLLFSPLSSSCPQSSVSLVLPRLSLFSSTRSPTVTALPSSSILRLFLTPFIVAPSPLAFPVGKSHRQSNCNRRKSRSRRLDLRTRTVTSSVLCNQRLF